MSLVWLSLALFGTTTPSALTTPAFTVSRPAIDSEHLARLAFRTRRPARPSRRPGKGLLLEEDDNSEDGPASRRRGPDIPNAVPPVRGEHYSDPTFVHALAAPPGPPPRSLLYLLCVLLI